MTARSWTTTVLALAWVAMATDARAVTMGEPDIRAELVGQSIKGGKALTALVEVDVESATSAVFRITNTTAQTPGQGEAVLRRFGFQLADGPKAKCLKLESDSGHLKLKKVARPFCFWASWGMTCWDDTDEPGKKPWKQAWKESLFSYNVRVKSPVAKHGIHEGQSETFRLTLSPKCAGDFAFTPDAFLFAPVASAVGQQGNMAAKFKIFGGKKKDRGCSVGNAGAPSAPVCTPEFTWAVFSANTSLVEGLPIGGGAPDTRAGSFNLELNGGVGFGGPWTDAPFEAVTATLTNGAGQAVEVIQGNRRWPPDGLDADGCEPGAGFPVCWTGWEAALDGLLSIALPDRSGDSNDGFDGSGLRPTIAVQVDQEKGGTRKDSAHQTVTVTWHAPLGLEGAQLHLQGRYDGNPSVTLVSVNIGNEDVFAPGVLVDINEDLTTLTATFNVQAGLEHVCSAYAE